MTGKRTSRASVSTVTGRLIDPSMANARHLDVEERDAVSTNPVGAT
jgi:hypothetical protein